MGKTISTKSNIDPDFIGANDYVVVRRQNEIRVFENNCGGITIESTGDDDFVQRVFFHVEHADAICRAVCFLKKEIESRGDE